MKHLEEHSTVLESSVMSYKRIWMSCKEKIKTILEQAREDYFKFYRVQVKSIFVNCSSDVSVSAQWITSGNAKINSRHVRSFSMTINHLRNILDASINFIKINPWTVCVVVLFNVSRASAAK